ncbi:MAG TPA: 3'-5' exonuclease [Chitinophagaceae bacterium]|nr:3'-5' exonuclease [Chitinophagaceae bacterium]
MPPLNHILFLDIETASQHNSFDELPKEWKELWQAKAAVLQKYHADITAELLYNRAGIYAEFGKIICISCGILKGHGTEKKLILKSFYSENEHELLQEFCNMLQKWNPENTKFLCAHNGKEFDFPYLARRMTINGMKLPACLQVSGKRPWELPFLDTMELWKFGDYKSFTSLNLLAHTLGIPSPKDDIDGSMVSQMYWSAKTPDEKRENLLRIVEYCQKDVITVAQVYLRLQGEDMIQPHNIEIKYSWNASIMPPVLNGKIL